MIYEGRRALSLEQLSIFLFPVCNYIFRICRSS